MNHTTQSAIIVTSMLAALAIAGISIVTSMQAQALSLRSSEGEHNTANQNNLCITNNNIGDEPITSNPCKPPEAEERDTSSTSQ
ncbi:MAG: hypothetical protein ACJ73C_13720 [Nitrososphaeraceae archaeon]